MTITLALQPQEEARLIAVAQAKGVSTGELVREALNKILADSPELEQMAKTESRPIWEVMLNNVKDVSLEEFAQLPADGASEHDIICTDTLKDTNDRRICGYLFLDRAHECSGPRPRAGQKFRCILDDRHDLYD